MAWAIQRSVRWLPVAGRWTRISIMGHQLNEELVMVRSNGDDDRRTIILIIPGNPGNEGFYEHFAREILMNLEDEKQKTLNAASNQYVLYTVSHLNHVSLPNEFCHNGAHRPTDRFNLNDQIRHKIDFCLEYLPKTSRIVMFGHSIGSYIMLRILPVLLENEYNVVCAGSLFPTIERMAESSNGQRLFPILSRLNSFDTLLTPILFWVRLLPIAIKRWLCSWVLPKDNVPKCVLESAAELLDVNVFRNIIHMCVDELNSVRKLDESLLKHNGRIRFYYGTTDKWCPIRFGNEMKSRLGEDMVIIDDAQCEHAFVINNNEVIARKVLNWILQ